MTKDELNNNEEYGEVAELLGRLKKVEAPSDFDFRVKARIASGKPSQGRLFGIPVAARYAAILTVLLLVGGTAGYYVVNIGTGEFAATPVVVPSDTAPPLRNDGGNSPGAANLEVAIREPDASGNVVPDGRDTANLSRPSVNSQSPGEGSYVESQKPAKDIRPRGFDANGIRSARPGEFNSGAMVPVKDVLSMVGVNVRIDGASCVVGSINENSSGARAGVRIGDIVDSINNQKITATSSIKTPFTAKTIRVIRDGSPVTIDLSQQ